MSSFHAAFSIGGLIGAAMGGGLAWAGWGIEGQLWIPLCLAGVITAVATPAIGPGQRSAAGQGMSLALPERRAWALCSIALLCFLLEGAMADWSAVYLASETGASDGAAASGYAAFSIAIDGRTFRRRRRRAATWARAAPCSGAASCRLWAWRSPCWSPSRSSRRRASRSSGSARPMSCPSPSAGRAVTASRRRRASPWWPPAAMRDFSEGRR